jgi:hypothetical protein
MFEMAAFTNRQNSQLLRVGCCRLLLSAGSSSAACGPALARRRGCAPDSHDPPPREKQASAPPQRAEQCRGSPGGSSVVKHWGYRQRRVILTERSEVDSESRRQPAVFIAWSASDARHEPPSLLSFAVKAMGRPELGAGDDRRPAEALTDLPPSEERGIRRTRSASPGEAEVRSPHTDAAKRPSGTTKWYNGTLNGGGRCLRWR